MDFKTRVRIFLTKYMELVKEYGLAIGDNMYDDSSRLILRINSDLRDGEEDIPSYVNFYGEDPNLFNGKLDGYFAIMYTNENKMVQLDPYEELPTYDTGYKTKSQEEINEELRALGLIK